jgi:hypothetical protein
MGAGMYDDVLNKVCRTLEDATSSDPFTIHGDTVLTDVEGWDSLGVVFFLGEVARLWPRVTVPAADLEGAKVVHDLARVVAARLG